MHKSYEDIRGLTDREPEWWDEHGVPRYRKFAPSDCPDIYASEAVLFEVRCQGCGRRYHVGQTRSGLDYVKHPKMWSIGDLIKAKALEYGDPPNDHRCGGNSMNSEPRRVIEYWSRLRPLEGLREVWRLKDIAGYMEWRRDSGFEVDITPDWVKGG